jgi:23S rRNA (uridine2552-2'-O)-methyltransferase
MGYNPKDHFFKKAKSEDYLARSVYKLQEIDEKHKLIRKNDIIVDLGASPGSWSQYCLKKLGQDGRLIGIDLTDITAIKDPRYTFYHEDIFRMNWPEELAKLDVQKVDVVLSDMAPKTTGIRLTDQMRSLELCEMALLFSSSYLCKGGSFVCKLFHSDQFKEFQTTMKKQFKRVEVMKPESTRKISKEIFLIGLDRI